MQLRTELTSALSGAMATLAASYFMALLFAYAFRIPIPLTGYYGPFGDISTYSMSLTEVLRSVLVAWIFYGVFGGFIILSILGAVAGVVAGRKYSASEHRIGMIVLYSAAASALPVVALSILDYIIGPW